MKITKSKPLTITRKIVYTLILLLLAYAGGWLGLIIAVLAIIWVWRQETRAR